MPTFAFHAGVLFGFDFLDFLHAPIITVSSFVHLPSCVWKMLFLFCSQLEPLAPTTMIPKPWEEGCDINIPFKDGYSSVSFKCYHCVLTLLLELWNFRLSSISRIPSRVFSTTVMFGKCAVLTHFCICTTYGMFGVLFLMLFSGINLMCFLFVIQHCNNLF